MGAFHTFAQKPRLGCADAGKHAATRPVAMVGIGCTIAFLVVAVLVARRGGLPFDAPFTAWLQAVPLPIGFWEACTLLGGVFPDPGRGRRSSSRRSWPVGCDWL